MLVMNQFSLLTRGTPHPDGINSAKRAAERLMHARPDARISSSVAALRATIAYQGDVHRQQV
jgi:hypothetical protein